MKFNERKAKLKILFPYVYTTGELAECLRTSYRDIQMRRISGEFVSIAGKNSMDHRFSYFALPKWVQELLPVPMAVMVATRNPIVNETG